MNASRINASLGKLANETNSSGDDLETEEWPNHQGQTGLVSSTLNGSYIRIVGRENSRRTSLNSQGSGYFRTLDSNREEILRRKVAFFFMDPVRKFIARRQAPWKLMFQFSKILLVTIQLVIFGNYRYAHTNYYSDNEIGFQHLFLKGWDAVREINTYPPTTGVFALYTRSAFYDIFDFTADNFKKLPDIAINPFRTNSTLDFCIQSFVPDSNYPVDEFVDINYSDQSGNIFNNFSCLFIPEKDLTNFSSLNYLKSQNFEVPWQALEFMFFNFTIKTVTFRQMGPLLGPACFSFKIKILFDNSDHDGQITIKLDTIPSRIPCAANTTYVATTSAIVVRFLDYTIIANCVISFVLCCRALFRAQILCVETREFFKTSQGTDLTASERFQFLNLWYIVICVNDVFLIIGSVLKELIELRETSGDLWNFCSVFLGSGSLLVWLGMLRYLGFFDAYNVLILTIKGALPNVVRFMICAGMVYLGYTFCGWVVLGPYHFKFRTLESTSECLFSLVNGDDMFATFSMISLKAPMIHGFSRVYLYSFVMLFIYVILSLFIAIILDTYEVIKEYYKKGFPKSRVDDFYMSGNCDPYSDIFLSRATPSFLYRCFALAMRHSYGEAWSGHAREFGRPDDTSDAAGSSATATVSA